MLLKNSLLVQPVSGFVPFSEGGNATPASVLDASPSVAAPIDPASPAQLEDGLGVLRPTWQPGSTKAVLFVEAAVVVAICAYFSAGLARLAHWL